MAIKQEPNSPLIITVAAVSGFLILVLYFGAEAWFRSEETAELATQWDHNPNAWLNDLRASQKANLSTHLDGAMKQILANNGKLTPVAPTTQPAGAAPTASVN